MGKASSSKKVARAAGTGGGRTNRGRTPWLYYGAILAVIVLGTAAVVSSRNTRLRAISASGKTDAPRVGQDHWHVAYTVYVCGKFQPSIKDQTDPVGIHTHGDGVIHVHPFVDSAAGKNATLGKFASTVHMTLNAGELKMPGGKDYRDGDTCEGKPGRVQVQVFANVADTVGTLSQVDPRDVPLVNQQMLTIAFMPKGAKIPPPPASVINNLLHLNDVASTATTTTTKPGSTTPTSGPTTTIPATTTTATSAPKTSSTTAKK